MYSQTDNCVCIIYTHTPLPDMFMPVPSSCPLIFLFHWQDTGKEKKRRARGRDDCLLQRGAEQRQTFLRCHPSVLPIRGVSLAGHAPLIWVISSGVDQVRHEAVRHGRVWKVNSATPIFHVQQFTSSDNNISERPRAEGSTADGNLAGVLMMEAGLFLAFYCGLVAEQKNHQCSLSSITPTN